MENDLLYINDKVLRIRCSENATPIRDVGSIESFKKATGKTSNSITQYLNKNKR